MHVVVVEYYSVSWVAVVAAALVVAVAVVVEILLRDQYDAHDRICRICIVIESVHSACCCILHAYGSAELAVS
jgi:hypothetical protein